jgi:hypothetical protein
MLWVAGFVFGGCGYQFSGQSTFLPKDVRTIYVEPFINRTRSVGLDKEVASAVRSEFYRGGRLRLVDRADQADAIVSGVIRSLESHVVSVNRKDSVLQYEATLSADVTLRRTEPNEILWRSEGMNLAEIYSGSRAAVVTTSSDFKSGTLNASDVRRMTDIQLTENQEQQARDQIIDRFARELHQRLMEMF